MDDTHRIVAIGFDPEEYRWFLDEFESHLGSHGITVTKRYTHPKPTAVDARAALADEDMRRKNASWIREVPEKCIRSVLEYPEQRGDEIWGYSVTVEAEFGKVTRSLDELPNFMETVEYAVVLPDAALPRDAPDLEYQDDGVRNPNAPFSYDPAQDYYTEPDR